MSFYTFVAVSGGSIGLVLGGALTQAIDWHWIFMVNIPIGLADPSALQRAWIEDDRGPRPERQAWTSSGSLLMTLSMMVGIYAVVKVPEYGWGSLHTLGTLAAAGG